MADIRDIYNSTLSTMYPYDFEVDRTLNGNAMLYNLVCIAMNNFTDLEDEENRADYSKIMTLIDLLTILGYKPSID